MDEAREKELREKAQEAIERWNPFMTVEEIIEEVMEVLDEAKSRNQKKEMLGFRFIWEKETSKWAVFPTWASDQESKEVVPLTPAVTRGRCRVCAYLEVKEFWKSTKKLRSSEKGSKEILMNEFIFE